MACRSQTIIHTTELEGSDDGCFMVSIVVCTNSIDACGFKFIKMMVVVRKLHSWFSQGCALVLGFDIHSMLFIKYHLIISKLTAS